MKEHKFDKLIKKYQQGRLSDEQKKIVDEWLATLGEKGTSQSLWEEVDIRALEVSLFRKIAESDSKQVVLRRRLYVLIGAAAASIILLLGFWLLSDRSKFSVEKEIVVSADQIFPSEEAVTLSIGGKTIELSSDKEGISLSDSTLVYGDGSRIVENVGQAKRVEWYVLSTPKGRQYQVTLPDGTKVWLNAASTLRYPSRFNDSVREVELDGEAYFSVVKKENAQQDNFKTPFVVKSAHQSIKVLGTQFNVSAYSNTHQMETSLVEGVVEVADNKGNRKVLQPNQQSVIDVKREGMQVKKVDATSVSEWRNNLFVFHGVSLKDIMKEVERWYGVTADIAKWPQERFYGEVQRDMPLSEVLKMVEMSSNLRFKVVTVGEERRLLML